jgi:hypothetical protein
MCRYGPASEESRFVLCSSLYLHEVTRLTALGPIIIDHVPDGLGMGINQQKKIDLPRVVP